MPSQTALREIERIKSLGVTSAAIPESVRIALQDVAVFSAVQEAARKKDALGKTTEEQRAMANALQPLQMVPGRENRGLGYTWALSYFMPPAESLVPELDANEVITGGVLLTEDYASRSRQQIDIVKAMQRPSNRLKAAFWKPPRETTRTDFQAAAIKLAFDADQKLHAAVETVLDQRREATSSRVAEPESVQPRSTGKDVVDSLSQMRVGGVRGADLTPFELTNIEIAMQRALTLAAVEGENTTELQMALAEQLNGLRLTPIGDEKRSRRHSENRWADNDGTIYVLETIPDGYLISQNPIFASARQQAEGSNPRRSIPDVLEERLSESLEVLRDTAQRRAPERSASASPYRPLEPSGVRPWEPARPAARDPQPSQLPVEPLPPRARVAGWGSFPQNGVDREGRRVSPPVERSDGERQQSGHVPLRQRILPRRGRQADSSETQPRRPFVARMEERLAQRFASERPHTPMWLRRSERRGWGNDQPSPGAPDRRPGVRNDDLPRPPGRDDSRQIRRAPARVPSPHTDGPQLRPPPVRPIGGQRVVRTPHPVAPVGQVAAAIPRPGPIPRVVPPFSQQVTAAIAVPPAVVDPRALGEITFRQLETAMSQATKADSSRTAVIGEAVAAMKEQMTAERMGVRRPRSYDELTELAEAASNRPTTSDGARAFLRNEFPAQAEKIMVQNTARPAGRSPTD